VDGDKDYAQLHYVEFIEYMSLLSDVIQSMIPLQEEDIWILFAIAVKHHPSIDDDLFLHYATEYNNCAYDYH